VRNTRQRALGRLDRLERRLVVQGRQRRQLADGFLHLLIEDDRVTKAGAAVDDPVSDCVAVDLERVDRLRLVPSNEMQLQARRAGVDD
jgi:hypothetical protein